MRPVRRQPVLNDDELEMRLLAPEVLEVPAGGLALSVVLVGTIVAPDHFRRKGKDGLDRRVHQGSGKHLISLGGGAASVAFDGF